MSSKFIICVTVILTLSVFDTSQSNSNPVILEAILGDTAELECPGNITPPKWKHIPLQSEVSKTVADKQEVNQEYSRRISIKNDNFYNLVIKGVQRNDAGLFICGEGDKLIKVQLVVLESSPECYKKPTSSDVVADNTCGIEPDMLWLYCKVRYTGNVAPVLNWNGIEEQFYNSTTFDGAVSNNVAVKAQWNQSIYACSTTTLNRPCYAVLNPIYVFDTTKHQTINWPQSITCSANGSQSCSYEWFFDKKSVTTNQTLDLTTESQRGEYKCVAQCRIREKLCTIEPCVVSYDYVPPCSPENSASSTTSLVAIVVLTALITFILTIVALTISVQFNAFDRIAKIGKHLRSIFRKRKPLYDPVPANEQRIDWTREITLKLRHEINTPGHIKGMTVVGNNIYIVRRGSTNIEGYSLETHDVPTLLPVADLKEPVDMGFCKVSNCFYVCDSVRQAIYKVSFQSATRKWDVKCPPEGISVKKDTTILVTCPEERKIIELSSDGRPLKTIELDVEYPRHACMTKAGLYLICSGHNQPRQISLRNSDGDAISDPFTGNGHNMEENMYPTRSTETEDGFFIVAICSRILLFDSNLQLIRELYNAESGHKPTRIYLDESRRRLYLTENEKNGKILIYDICDTFA